ncbi:DUF418 domain-containing protein [Lysobacter soyae]|uniref:DUF418 domain-containing protein n=1 Tax=Lysobacter soyae TaxID=2764185 RepID=A0ABX8WNU8_9GAMM|nr:DUF418 domain-containing protein [Lysobacter sp. CJ11]QYR52376.1 DUF418 domain-containing protein [Lysobacter sp. CJ11]
MSDSTLTGPAMGPVEGRERIHVMDVLRGFALLGICLMNIEFFNSPTYEFQRGLPPDLTGIDRLAGWAVMVFVTGKFWLLFSLLFGMGFALMLSRARERGAPFVKTYLRRTFALMLIGLAHAILLWNGDILFGYSLTALMLLLALFGKPWHWLVTALVVAALCLATGNMDWSAAAVPLIMAALLAPYLRAPGKPWRLWRAGAVIYALFVLMQLAGGIAMSLNPEARAKQTVTQQAEAQKHLQKIEQFERDESAAFQSPSFQVGLAQRAKSFTQHHMPNYTVFSVIAISMFLIGAWFVQSGRIANAAQYTKFWRAWLWVFPLALAITAASMWIGDWMPRGIDVQPGRAMIGAALRMGAAPLMTLGYIAMIVLLFQQASARKYLAWMAPAGRMALTNYLMQSLVCAFVFYGWGLQQWGMPRHQQILFVAVLWLAQLALSALWLQRFKYGPMEWLWRWMTYGQAPAMRQVALTPSH